MKLKLYKVIAYFNHEVSWYTFDSFVIAGNEIEAQRIVEEEMHPSINNMTIKSIEEIDMEFPQFLFTYISDQCFGIGNT